VPLNLARHTWTRDADFRGATFFDSIDFSYSEFQDKVDFRYARFCGDATFRAVTFAKDVSFRNVVFCAHADFSFARFSAYARFVGDPGHDVFENQSTLSLQYACIERPDRFSFHSVRLRPDWFLYIDVRKFDLTDIRWDRHLKPEIEILRGTSKLQSPHLLLSITYRQLAVNTEENHQYFEAAEFRYASMEVLRWRNRYKDGIKHYYRSAIWYALQRGLQNCRTRPLRNALLFCGEAFTAVRCELANRKHSALASLTWWYWLMSGYGEKAVRATVGLTAILISFGILYASIGLVHATVGQRASGVQQFLSALVFEVVLLQKPEPRPASVLEHLIVGIETLLGPLQGALLALAIRRRFMR
jgi:hypothetical protein